MYPLSLATTVILAVVQLFASLAITLDEYSQSMGGSTLRKGGRSQKAKAVRKGSVIHRRQ